MNIFLHIHIYFGRATGHARILVYGPRIEPVPPAVEVQSLNHWTSREVPTFFLRVLRFNLLCLGLWSILVNYCMWCDVNVHFILLHVAIHSSQCQLLRIIFFSHSWHCVWKPVDHRQMGLFMKSHSIPMIYMSIPVSLPHYLHYHCSAESFEIRKCWVLLLDFCFHCFGYSGYLAILSEFLKQFNDFYKEVSWDSDRDCTESVDHLEEYCHLKILSSNVRTWEVIPCN